MIAAICALLSALAFYFSIGLGEQWALAWVAPIPVLWLAFGEAPLWRAFAMAFVAYAIGEANYFTAYLGVMPPLVLALLVGAPALLFGVAVGAAGLIRKRLGWVAGVMAFASLWAAFDFISAFNRAGGSATTPAAAEVDAPMLVQVAAFAGFVGVTFLLGAVSAALAAALRTRTSLLAITAIGIFALNAAFGAWRMSAHPTGAMRVMLIASNDAVGNVSRDDEDVALQTIDAYAAEIDRLRSAQPDLVLLPENIARLAPEWREAAQAPLATAARQAHATLVAGFNTRVDGAQRNVAWAFAPNASTVTYEKRRLVLGLETRAYKPGASAQVLDSGVGLEICKDMDFHSMIRADIASAHPTLLAVPAWDFGADGWAHARIALLRSVENGVPMARAARNGWLTVNDRYGRIIARTRVTSGFATLVSDVPLSGLGGATIYSRIGDVFGWTCVTLATILLFAALAKGRRQQ